uniref:Uncharacterized protein n=1 Tax=viral metagenome TaxID=1070528 RepID=A0A6C0DR14_9ZZZZ
MDLLDNVCTPAIVYLVLSMITIMFAIYNNARVFTILIKWLFVLLWAWVLNFICKSGYPMVAWFLVLLPYLLMLLTIAIVIEMMQYAKNTSQ